MNKKLNDKKIYIKNSQHISELLIENNINFYQLSEFISSEDIIIHKSFDVKKEYDTMNPHALLKPIQSGLDLPAISFEGGDNSTDANCKILEYRFDINEDGSVNMIISDDGDGIKNHDIKKAVSYGGYFGPKDVGKSGKFMEGLSNMCGSAAGIIDIYTSNGNGQGWYKSTINFLKLKEMIKIYEREVIKLKGLKKELYTGIVYKYIASAYISNPVKTNIDTIKSILNKKILEKDKGTVILFKNCYTDIIDVNSLEEDIKKLKEAIGRRYWRDINNGIEISIINCGVKEIIKSIDFMMRSPECNYRGAFTTKFFELKKMFKVCEFTGKEEHNDYLSLNVAIKEKTELYTNKISKRIKKENINKILVPNILAIGIEHQGLSVERNNRPISDNVQCGLKKHNNYNGISVEICVDSRMDDVLFVTGDKSSLSERKLNRVFGKKLDFIISQAYKVKCNKQEVIYYENADGEYVEASPYIIRPQFLIKKDVGKSTNSVDNDLKNDLEKSTVSQNKPKVEENNNDDKGKVFPKKCTDVNNINLNSADNWVNGVVFAALGKSICRYDVDSNTMLYKKDDTRYLIFDDKIDNGEGVRNRHLQEWWSRKGNMKITLEERIKKSIPEKSIYQKIVFNTYKNKIEPILGENAPALFVEIELYHNSYTIKENTNSEPQRMDFCIIFPNNKKVLIEIDGIQHIGEKDLCGKWIASETKYARQCKFNNEWLLKGNEIYRIPNKLLKDMGDERCSNFIENFFISLLKKHNIIS